MTNATKVELFESTPLHKAIAKLSIPTVISSLVIILYNLADTYFVGVLNDPIQNAAVTLAAPVLLSFNAIINLFGIGGSSMMSRAMGRKDFDTVSRSSAFSFYCAIGSALLLSLLSAIFMRPLLYLLGTDATTINSTRDYLIWTTCIGATPAILNVVMSNLFRSEGSTLHAGIGTMLGCGLNIILDPIFIMPWGLNMGASGAGLATMLSNFVSCGYFLILLHIKRKTTWVCINPKMFGFKREIVSGICEVGIPAAIQNLLNVTGATVLNNYASGYGPDVVAAMGIASKITMVPMYVAMGIANGVMPLIGYNFASKNFPRMKEAFKKSTVVSIGFLTFTTLIFCLFSKGITKGFIDNDSVIFYGTSFIRALSLASPFLAMDFIVVGVFQATGMGKKSLFFAILRKVILEIPALVILNMLFPIYGISYSQLATEVIMTTTALVIISKLFKSLT